MARLHILTGSYDGIYDVVVHSVVPAGNNSAGVSWQTALSNSGLNTSRMPTGNGPGQISSSEANQVAAGSVLETSFIWQDSPFWDDAQRTADLATRATQAVTEAQDVFQHRLKLFGRTVA